MIFIRFDTKQRVRVNGKAKILENVIEAQKLFGKNALRMVQVDVEEVYANCPKYIHKDAGTKDTDKPV